MTRIQRTLGIGITSGWLLLAAGAAHARSDVWVVDAASGPGADFAQITDAVAAASEGDAILVRSGSYAPFTIQGTSLTVTADTLAEVLVDGTMTIEGLAAGQRVTLRNLNTGVASDEGLIARNNGGTLWLVQCTLDGGPGDVVDGAEIENCASVALSRCLVTGGEGVGGFSGFGAGYGHGLNVVDSQVYVHDSKIRGNDGDFGDEVGGWGGHGIFSTGSTVYVSDSTLRGGRGGDADSDLDPFGGGVSCGLPGFGGDGLHLHGIDPGEAHVLDTEFFPGAGGHGDETEGCPDSGPGTDVSAPAGAVTFLAGTARAFRLGSPVREGESTSLTFDGEPGDLVFVFASVSPFDLYLEALHGPLLVALPLTVVSFGALDPTGLLQVSVPAPNLAASLESVELFLQSVFVDGAASIYLGPHASLLTVDSAF